MLALLLGEQAAVGVAEHQLTAKVTVPLERAQRRAQKLGVRWVVSPQVFNSRIDLELTEGDDEQIAAKFVAKVLADLALA